MSAITELEDILKSAAERFGPSVVGFGRGWGTGSGAVIASGRVLTTARALRRPEISVVFGDGGRRDGTVLGVDRDLDLAVVEVDTGDVQPLDWPDNGTPPPIGRAVLALANPGGRGVRVTLGFVASAQRALRGARGGPAAAAIEHTAPLPRGSGGGPVLDREGRLLGINLIRAHGGLILAAHADAALRERVASLGRGESPRRARLGVAVASARAARELRRAVGLPDRDGLLVRAVEEGGPAAAAGVRRGDLITGLAGRPTTTIEALYEAIQAAGTDHPAELVLLRADQELTVQVQLS